MAPTKSKLRVKAISHSAEDLVSHASAIVPVVRNTNPLEHPFQKEREYVRAVRAAKLDKILARPFMASLNGHSDAIVRMALHPIELSVAATCCIDGELRIWDVSSKKSLTTIPLAHDSLPSGLAFVSPLGNELLSCGQDKKIKRWKFDFINPDPSDESHRRPVKEYTCTAPLHHLDVRFNDETIFATGSSDNYLRVWDSSRTTPIQSYSPAAENLGQEESLHHVKFNKTETNLIGALCKDRSFFIYDIRMSGACRSVTLSRRSNALSWNPLYPHLFLLANDDFNTYGFDLRNLSQCVSIYSDHVGPVTDVDYSPTGLQFVTSSWDKTLRLWNQTSTSSQLVQVFSQKRFHDQDAAPEDESDEDEDMDTTKANKNNTEDRALATFYAETKRWAKRKSTIVAGVEASSLERSGFGHSRDVYFTPRMGKINCCAFSLDSHYIFSGSEDANLRVWKSEAARPLRVVNKKEQSQLDYYASLKEKFADDPAIRQIRDHKILPKEVYHKKRILQEIRRAKTRANNKRKTFHKKTTLMSAKKASIVAESK